MGNKHYHCWEWLDIDTATPYTHKICHCRLAEKRGVGWEYGWYRKKERWKDARISENEVGEAEESLFEDEIGSTEGERSA